MLGLYINNQILAGLNYQLTILLLSLGITTKSKLNPKETALLMRSTTTKNGSKMFKPKYYLEEKQIKSVFSRMMMLYKINKLQKRSKVEVRRSKTSLLFFILIFYLG